MIVSRRGAPWGLAARKLSLRMFPERGYGDMANSKLENNVRAYYLRIQVASLILEGFDVSSGGIKVRCVISWAPIQVFADRNP